MSDLDSAGRVATIVRAVTDPRPCSLKSAMDDSPPQYYDADSLESAARHFERAYGIDSDSLYDAYIAGAVPEHIPRFDAFVWASFVEEIRRLRSAEPDESPITRVRRTFAHA